jgi:glycine/D-amino acid oxidase-like deaminating enzyme
MSVVHSPSRHVCSAASAPTTWYHASAKRPFARTDPLVGEMTADVVIIGAGFTGVSAALDLAIAGLNVVVLEANEIGAGASGRNGGLACSGWRHDQKWLEARMGREDGGSSISAPRFRSIRMAASGRRPTSNRPCDTSKEEIPDGLRRQFRARGAHRQPRKV